MESAKIGTYGVARLTGRLARSGEDTEKKGGWERVGGGKSELGKKVETGLVAQNVSRKGEGRVI